MDTRHAIVRHRPGYVLLMTLLLLMIVAAAMTSACRYSLSAALQAEDGERCLQSKWAAISCRQELLPRCEEVLAGQERDSHRVAISSRRSVTLSGRTLQLVFADESAKVNVQSMFDRLGGSDTLLQLRTLLSGSGMTAKLHLRPGSFEHPANSALHLQPHGELASFGSILDQPDPAALLEPHHGLPCLADQLTCWGDGRLNWLRAGEKTLRTVLTPQVSLVEIQKLVSLRPADPGQGALSLEDAISACGLTAAQRSFATQRLGGASTCHSLWVLTTEGDRIIYHFYVSEAHGRSTRGIGYEW